MMDNKGKILAGIYTEFEPGYLDMFDMNLEEFLVGISRIKVKEGDDIEFDWVDYDNDTGLSELRFLKPISKEDFEKVFQLPYSPIYYDEPKNEE